MRILNIICCAAAAGVFMCAPLPSHAQAPEETSVEEEIPPGMEAVYVGNTRTIVPIGTKIKKVGNAFIRETLTEYSARKFMEIGQRVDALYTSDKKLEQEVALLKSKLQRLRQMYYAAASGEENTRQSGASGGGSSGPEVIIPDIDGSRRSPSK